MEQVFLIIHVLIAVALIGVVLIQRSENDGFGLGSGSGANLLTGRQTANILTRTTAILATAFMLNSLWLGVLAANIKGASLVDRIEAVSETSGETAPVEVPASADDGESNDGATEPQVPVAE